MRAYEHTTQAGALSLRLGEYADLSIKMGRVASVLDHHSTVLDRFLVVTPRDTRIRTRG